ncbi:hypothetical protein INS49_000002 [Diaporthe citri]|uniref:uncharacterized protein n=1 Tax=Diaporthe citri TaxID=83186 RepID=UPI001C7F890A|nr:uncharacterized protein INS49_000002 [Diaporthe citri]KAG6365826.1 hypothetical protein INS49_000002 [Diaporthe citri]
MDPLTAVGLVLSVITFIDFGYKAVSAAKEVHASASGTTAANDHIKFLNIRMEALATDLAAAKSYPGGMSADKLRLVELADKCLGLSGDLKKLIDKLKTWKPDWTNAASSYTYSSPTQRGMKSHSKLQDEARIVLELSDMAVSKVLQNRILEALRFEKMESRFYDITEAHVRTFKWLLEEGMPSSLTTPTVDMQDLESTSMLGYFKADDLSRRCIQKSFTGWLSDGKGIFHISGKPGAGKSTLMKFLVESDEVRKYLNIWLGEKELIFASFFFWRHGTEFQKSL